MKSATKISLALITEDSASWNSQGFLRLPQAKFVNFLEISLTESFCWRSLKLFMDSYPRLVMSLPEEFEIVGSGQEEWEDGGDQEGNDVSTCLEDGKTWKSCFTCAYNVLHQYSLNSTAYSELYTVYIFLTDIGHHTSRMSNVVLKAEADQDKVAIFSEPREFGQHNAKEHGEWHFGKSLAR